MDYNPKLQCGNCYQIWADCPDTGDCKRCELHEKRDCSKCFGNGRNERVPQEWIIEKE